MLLDFLRLAALQVRPLTIAEFDSVIDKHGADLPGIIDQAFFTAPRGQVVDTASQGLGTHLVQQLSPISRDLIAMATGRHPEQIARTGSMVVAATVAQIISELFPADDTITSLRAAVAHIVGRIGLKSEAGTFGATKQ